jgi:hypothetical protein
MSSTPIQKELGRIAADYRRFLIIKALSFCWGIAALIGLALFAISRFSGYYYPSAVPALLGLCVFAAIIVYLRASRSSPGLRQIARQVEHDDPKLNTLLLAALEQNPDPQSGQLNFLQTRVIREAVEANRRSPWNQKFTERLFFAQGVHFMTLGLLAAALFALTLERAPAGSNHSGQHCVGKGQRRSHCGTTAKASGRGRSPGLYRT